ncbi:MAG: DJ-1/PfpI family protein [Nitrospirae bacterium]|nr:DJ-1/PfpI family protein [Nitrospirota bacterium]
MPKVAVILADGFEEVEAMAIIDVLRRAEIDVAVTGLHDGQVLSARKVKVIPDTVIDNVKADDFDMIVLPGGQPGSDNLNAESRSVINSTCKSRHWDEVNYLHIA